MLFHRPKKSNRAKNKSGRRLCFEGLEERRLLATMFSVNQPDDDGTGDAGTLSWAINQVNGAAEEEPFEQYTIRFTGSQITIDGQLPIITAPIVTINGDPFDNDTRAKIVRGDLDVFGPITYEGDAGSVGQLMILDIEISGFDTSAIRIDSLSDSDSVQIVNSVFYDNDGSGVLIQDKPTANGFIWVTDSYIYGNGTGIVFNGAFETGTQPNRNWIFDNTFGADEEGTPDPNTDHDIRFGIGISEVDVFDNTFVGGGDGAILLQSHAGDEIRITDNVFHDPNGDTSGLIVLVPDGETGPNNLLGAPVLRQDLVTLAGGEWSIPLDVDFDAEGDYLFEFYRYDHVTDEWTHVDDAEFDLQSTGSQQLTAEFADSIFDEGDIVAAIAIGNSGDNENNTSEFAEPIILDVTAPRITDVVLDGDWDDEDLTYSYAAIVPTGGQLRPIFTEGVDTIQIVFSEAVVMSASGTELTLYGSNGTTITPDDFDHVAGSNVATWTFNDPLPTSKYRIELTTAVEDMAGNALDGDWMNVAGPDANAPQTWDGFSDDEPGRTLLSGNGVAGGDFEFFFSVLPGDYDQNGVRDGEDLNALGDGNGDGVVDSADETVGSGTLFRLPFSKRSGDYNDNELLENNVPDAGEFGDYELWVFEFGNVPPADMWADGNDNGVVDAADYTVWADNYLSNPHSFSAGYTGPLPPAGGGGGSGGELVQFGVAPMVVNVTISGSQSTHDPYAFDAVAGSGEQLRTVPVGGADTISITFSEDVNVVASDLTLTGLRTANRPPLAEFSYDLATMTATWRFETIITGDHYLVSLSDAVNDVEGDQLDGEWVNPASISTTNPAVSHFPSGDGTMGGDFNFVVTLLPGDASLDLVVDMWDYYGIFASNYGNWTEGAQFWNADFNGDGIVNMADVAVFPYGVNLQNVWVLADLNGDWVVDGLDGAILFGNSGLQNPTQADGDLNGDGSIDVADLDLLFAQYGLELAVAS